MSKEYLTQPKHVRILHSLPPVSGTLPKDPPLSPAQHLHIQNSTWSAINPAFWNTDDEDDDDDIQPRRPYVDDEDIQPGDAGQDDPPGDEGDSEHEDSSQTESLPLSVLEDDSELIQELESVTAEIQSTAGPRIHHQDG